MPLSAEQKAAIINERLTQFEAEKFQHELNRDVAVAINNSDAIIMAESAIAQLDAAIAVHETQLADLTPATVVDEPSA